MPNDTFGTPIGGEMERLDIMEVLNKMGKVVKINVSDKAKYLKKYGMKEIPKGKKTEAEDK
jgi:hypothetical protein